MAKLSPLQRVRAEHISKQKLAEKILGILPTPEGEDSEDFAHRVNTMSNTKLLRIWDSHQAMVDKHGSREALINKIVEARFPRGNNPYRAKIEDYTTTRLLELARQSKV